MEATENIKDTVITLEDKLRSTSEESEAKIEEEVRELNKLDRNIEQIIVGI